jgi:hypothetical protein
MITRYGKTYETLYTGSMVGAGAVVFAVMGYVIANGRPETRDPESSVVVELNPKLLGAILGEAVKPIEKAIDFLCEEDPESRSQEEGGRRLLREGQFRYRVVNGRYYRGLADQEKRAEQMRKASAKYRAKKKWGESGAALEGEKEYCAAVAAGAGEEELERIVKKWLPKKDQST